MRRANDELLHWCTESYNTVWPKGLQKNMWEIMIKRKMVGNDNKYDGVCVECRGADGEIFEHTSVCVKGISI